MLRDRLEACDEAEHLHLVSRVKWSQSELLFHLIVDVLIGWIAVTEVLDEEIVNHELRCIGQEIHVESTLRRIGRIRHQHDDKVTEVFDLLVNVNLSHFKMSNPPYNFNSSCTYATESGKVCGIRGTLLTYPFCEKCIVKKRCYATLGWTDTTLNECRAYITANPRAAYAATSLPSAPVETQEAPVYKKHEWIEEVEKVTDDDIIVPGEEEPQKPAPPTSTKGDISDAELSSIDQLFNDALHSKSFAADSARNGNVKKLPDAKQQDPDFKVRKRAKAEPSGSWLNEVEELDLNDLRAEVLPPEPEPEPEVEDPGEPSPEQIKAQKRKEAAEMQSFMILNVGFNVMMGIAENMGGKRLRGLQENCNCELIQSNLEECAAEFREMVGLDTMDPWSKLCLSVAMIGGATWTQNLKNGDDDDLYDEEEDEEEEEAPARMPKPKVAPATVVIDEEDLYRDV